MTLQEEIEAKVQRKLNAAARHLAECVNLIRYEWPEASATIIQGSDKNISFSISRHEDSMEMVLSQIFAGEWDVITLEEAK